MRRTRNTVRPDREDASVFTPGSALPLDLTGKRDNPAGAWRPHLEVFVVFEEPNSRWAVQRLFDKEQLEISQPAGAITDALDRNVHLLEDRNQEVRQRRLRRGLQVSPPDELTTSAARQHRRQ